MSASHDTQKGAFGMGHSEYHNARSTHAYQMKDVVCQMFSDTNRPWMMDILICLCDVSEISKRQTD